MRTTYIKIVLVINFLSEKNNSVRFQFHFVSFYFLSILVVTVQYSSGRVAFDTDSQTVPPEQRIKKLFHILILEKKHLLSRIQPQFEPDSVPAPIAAPLVREDDAAPEADREDEAPIGAVGGEQLALVR